MKTAISSVVNDCMRQRKLINRKEFLWPLSITEVPVRIPGIEDGAFRDIEYIPPEEIWGGMLLIVKQSVGINSEALVTETARLFGYNRVAEKVRVYLSGILAELVTKGGVIYNGESLTLPKK